MSLDYNKIAEAAQLLELGERASIRRIKDTYKTLMQKWHPDNCKEERHHCEEMSKKITAAYRLLMDFCNSYAIPLNKEMIEKEMGNDDPEVFWKRKFGSDPHWGGPGYG
ncbi:MAG: J domain-containing protein [Spirochaetota bacterium]